MKKGIIYSVLLSFMFMLCGVFYGCGGRYDDLSMSAFFEYDTNLNLLENDDDEIYRYQDEGGLRFDDNKDGSYTFYITPSTPATVSLKVEFDGMPDDFNKLASVTPTNELVATVKKNVMQTDDGCVRDIVIHSAGETSLNVLSDEGEKTVVINIKAVEIPTAINFVTSNYALAKNNGSYIDLSRDKAIRVVPSDSSVLKINYSFGSYDGFDFVPLTDEQLWQNGLSFNKNTNLLSVAVASQLDDLKSLWIEADYENPVGDNLKAYTQVKIVNVVDVDSFKIYTPQDELIEGTQDLINNVTDLNYMDVRLKVVTNGEKINFGIIDDGILPINEIDFDLIDVIYIGEYDSVTNNYADAYSAYVNLRIIASKKTVENANYNSDGIYNLKFTCNYADYTVAGYPITYGMDIKIYDLVKQFSINDEPIENEDLSSEGQFVGDCQSNVYINTANSAEGTVLKIGIANPANILKEYSRYTLSLYQFVENQSAPEWKDQLVSITNVAEYFKIKTATQVGGYKTTVSETMTEKFDKDTFFYIKADETSDKIAINQIYYLVIKAELPNDAEKQAVGVVRLDVVQGITAVQNYSYFAKNYQVDAATGKHTRVDPDSKEVLLYDKTKDEYYKLTDASLPDSETNRTYLEGELVEEVKNKNDISFEDYVGNEVVYIDLTSNFNANVILSYLPDGANLENLTISSSNNAIMQIGDYEDEFGVDISQKVAFSVVPKAIGEAEVLISASHLEQIYKIPVSIYKPITNMFVALSSTSWESGIGQHTTVIDAATQNKILESAVVMVGKSIVLNISTLPVSSSGYTLQYNLYEYNQDASGYDMANPVGEYIKYYDGKASDVLGSMKNTNGVFTFNCKTNIFMFTENASVNDKVLVCIKLINLDGTYIERYIELSSFMPVVSIDTNPNRDITLTNPNTIAYDLKKDEKNNDSVFALNIAVNKDAIPASFDFYNNGHITVLYNGQEEFYELRNGKLVYDLNNKILLPVQSEPDINGNYFFKLNPEYNYSKSYNTIVVMIDIKEFDNYFSKFLYVYMRYNTMVSSLITQNETDMYFKQGITDGKTFGFEVENDRADNKTVLSKVFNIVQLNNKIYYVESDPATTNTISNVELKLTNPTNKGDYTFEVVAENAGEAVVVLMPQDKIISKAQYDTWNNYSYQTININSGEFVTNFYYTFDGKNHVLAEEYDATQTYYIKSVAVESYVGIWADYLTVYITVADGDKVPYQISSINDLNEVSKTVESVTKRYVLVENLNFDTTIKWQPIGNYYVEDVDQHNYEKGKYYIYNGETYEISNGNFELGKKYYLYGFNGEFNFKYKHVDIKQNIVAETDYSILNLYYIGSWFSEFNNYGLFSILGTKAKVLWAKISYNFYSPTTTSGFVFGGVAGTNNGLIIGAQVEYSNTDITVYTDASVGGIVGINNGVINNNNYYEIDVTEDNYQKDKYYIYQNNRYQLCSDDIFDTEKTYYLYDAKALVNTQGILNVNVSQPNSENNPVNVGGIVAVNNAELSGSFVEEGQMEPVFNDAGFDSALNIVVTKTSSDTIYTNIGGAVGKNSGTISNISIQGSIKAAGLDNVGGIVGTALYVDGYSVKNSYSIAKVEGQKNVGGAIGKASGEVATIVAFYNISAENYASILNRQKTFVNGDTNVGGLVGYAENAKFEYCYSISYFDQIDLTGITSDKANYDVVGRINVGGFVGQTINTQFISTSSSVYVSGDSNTGIYAGSSDEISSCEDVFATGSVYSSDGAALSGLTIDKFSGFAYYNFNRYTTSSTCEKMIGYWDGDSLELGTTAEGIIAFFNDNENIDRDKWSIDSSASAHKINDGLPYLTINGRALFATVPLQVVATVNEIEAGQTYTTHIKNNDESLVLFYNSDYLNAYSQYTDRVQKLNLLSLNQIAALKVFAETYKSYRLDISVSGTGVLDILKDGTIKILGEGSEEIVISSKLNSKYQAKIYVVVKYGVNDITLYSNISFTTELDDCDDNNKIEILKSRNYSLYKDQIYTRSLTENAADVNLKNAELRSTNDYGVKFLVKKTDVNSILTSLNGAARDINELFKFNGLNWLDDGGEDYYINIPKRVNIFISPVTPFEDSLNIRYVPYLSETFITNPSVIYLNNFAGDFDFNIKKGATKIVIENNKDNLFSISQLQTQVFTVTMYTDYEEDEFTETFNLLDTQSYSSNNIWDVINGAEEAADLVNNYLTIVKSDVKRSYSDKAGKMLESISVTYTISYKDKINAVKEDMLFKLNFKAYSDTTVELTVGFMVLGQDKINQVYGSVYSNLSDFPQTPDKNNVIYNGTVGTLAIEVYPFFSNYDKLRVRYESASKHPMLITQLSYDINGSAGNKLFEYPDSGSISDFNEYLWIEKSSGQDTYLFNDLGVYSYSKTYFISLLVSTYVPDDSIYTIYVDILNHDNDIIETYKIEIKAVAQPSIRFSFDPRTFGNDDKYYLPLNTVNKMDVVTHNYDGEITWEISCLDDYVLTDEMKNVLTPYLDVDGNYYFKVMEYLGLEGNNVFTLEMLGKTIRIKGSIEDGRNSPKFGQNYYTVDVTFSLFTVLDVNVQNVKNGYLTVPTSTTTPLYTYIDAYYDKALTENKEDSWYNNLDREELEESLEACGYEIEDNFVDYITQLQNAISQARYSPDEEPTFKTSGVWFYSAEGGASSYLQTEKKYNADTFGVELYNDYFAVYGHQVDINSTLNLKVNLAYSNSQQGEERVVGIPNVYGHNASISNTTYESNFYIQKDFILTFVYKSDLINAIPVSTVEEFLTMKEGFDYRLINDIELSNYQPISTAINSFDGNNHTIYITSFAYNNDTTEAVDLGLFADVSKNTILYNVNVYYTNRVEYVELEMKPIANGMLNIGLLKSSSVKFGGIAATNNGSLTNCQVSGAITIDLNVDASFGLIGSGSNGGLVANNTETGYITNSKVVDFTLNCYGDTGGVVQNNSGKIVSTYLDKSSINNSSNSATGGFVHTNSGSIYECFVQGRRLSSDIDIRNSGTGITSKGIVAGFVYSNLNSINDCYANIKLSSSMYIAGFIYTDSSESVISRSYSICYKEKTDNAIVASPFFGTSDIKKITVSGKLINCFFLKGTGTWIEDSVYVNTEKDKVPVGLTFDEFATHSSFISFDLSLTYKTDNYVDGRTSYNYIDGYTWVIMDGKPVLVSTIVNTISEREYVGKTKTYSTNFNIYTAPKKPTGSPYEQAIIREELNDGKLIKFYNRFKKDGYAYTNEQDAKVDENLLYVVEIDFDASKMTYTFAPRDLGGNQKTQLLTIVYSIQTSGGKVVQKELLYAEYGDETKSILDVRESINQTYVDNDNYRANDTIIIKYKADPIELESIEYYVLENASYHYGDAVYGKSDVSGTRTNPQIIYDAESFDFYLASATQSKFFRIIKDIDFGYEFTKTSYSEFQGALQGNHMTLSRLSISYTSNIDDIIDTTIAENIKNAFGLFAKISAIRQQDYREFSTTIISNLKIELVEVLSSTHKFVGGLAGQVDGKGTGSTNVVLNNITISGQEGGRAFVQGNNAVGGLVGFAKGSVIIKDISSSISVNAAKEMDSSSNADTMLYIEEEGDNYENIPTISYAGGIIGIFDGSAIANKATLQNYNASNVSVAGDVTVIGGVSGGAFGLIGKSTVVNYANVLAKTSNKNFIKALSYAGGIVGELRGKLISSSVSYGSLESYSNIQPGASQFTENNFFYNGKISDVVVAIGGIAGFNNGGTISNSISSVDVRNANAKIAGGAVGRQVQGQLDNVITTGSVMANTIVGGLIGTVNDRDILTDAGGYDGDAIANNRTKTKLISNVSATNWLVNDYVTYQQMLNEERLVAGYIGLIATTSDSVDVTIDNGDKYSYYSNALYTSTTGEPVSHLKAAYKSKTFDSATKGERVVVDVLTNGSKQVVYPYSTREMYYENKFIGPNYTIKGIRNYVSDDDKIGHQNEFVEFVFTITESSGIININNLYKQIDLTGWDCANIHNNESDSKKLYEDFKKHFGEIYEKDGDNYKKVTSINNEEGADKDRTGSVYNYYYIPLDDLGYIETQVTYNATNHDIVPYSVEKKEDLLSLNELIIDGVYINISGKKFEKPDLTYSLEEGNDPLATLPNNTKITDISFVAVEEVVDSKTIYKIKSATLTYKYEFGDYISKVETSKDVNTTKHNLSVSSKEVIYKDFVNNGHWAHDENFYLNGDYEKATKYLTNLEDSRIYVWSDEGFVAEKLDIDESNKAIKIATAEELALFASEINGGSDYSEYTILLTNDIDLSGKYWVPIGLNSAFKGTFDGQGHTIKYATVNEKINNNNALPDYAGLFGKITNAIIKNLHVSGGDIKGNCAGGIVSQVSGKCTIENVTNNNVVEGTKYAGGIVGDAQSSKLSLINVLNNGQINIVKSSEKEVYAAGIAGFANSVDCNYDNIVNYGEINLSNMSNSYAEQWKKEASLKVNVGGVFGIVSSITNEGGSIANWGNINISTNAHFLNVGGVVGLYNADYANYMEVDAYKDGVDSSGLKNYGDININYRNIKLEDTEYSAYAAIGGVVGKTSDNILCYSNEGTITLTIATTTTASIGVGGIVGMTNGNIKECYNANNISVTSISKKTKLGMGGIVGLININQSDHDIADCFNSGDIFCDGNSTAFVGGIYGAPITEVENRFLVANDINNTSSRNNISRCLNIGRVNITTFNNEHNALGAIAGINAYLTQSNNYYLVDSAYSGSDIFTSVCKYDNGYVSLPDLDTGNGANGRKSGTLKDINSYSGWNNWEQAYDTWYPMLKNNKALSMWSDKQDVVSQEKGSYMVRTPEQLAYIADKINSGEINSNGITIQLGNSIDLSNRYWIPIGTSRYPFRGTFDGNSYVIRNMTIDGSVYQGEQKLEYGALFGYVVDAKITSVGLENPIVHKINIAASLVCFAENSRIEKVYSNVEGSEHSIISTGDGVGQEKTTMGAAGLVYSMVDCHALESNNMTGGLYYSYNNVPVKFAVANGKFNALSYVGGLVGNLQNSLIDNSYNNSNGKVVLSSNSSDFEIAEGNLIAGNTDKTSSLFNVFNLAELDSEAANGVYISDKKHLFTIEVDQTTAIIKSTETLPVFENFVEGEVDLKTIWTIDYSLNAEVSGTDAPSLRGLGQEWKNTESESLKVYVYDDTKKQEVEKDILDDLSTLGNETLFKIENPDLTYLQASTKSVYLISTAEELAWLAKNVNNGGLITTHCEFVLVKDINLTGKYWTPIGATSVYPFQGVFNFNGHTISGLTIDANNLMYGGLFGYTSNAYICNGYIKNAFVKITSNLPTTNIYAGTVVGKGYNTTIENMYVTTNLAGFSNASTFVGGIIGSLTGTRDYILSNVTVNTATNSSGELKYIDTGIYATNVKDDNSVTETNSTTEVTSSNVAIGAFSEGGNVYCGGIAGQMSGYNVLEQDKTYLVRSATNNSNIAAISTSTAGEVFVGGILGYGIEEVSLNIVKNTGHLKSYSCNYDSIGGIVGYLYSSSVSNALFTGNIEGSQKDQILTYLGGIIGQIDTEGVIENCINIGTIKSNANYKDIAVIGGIVGRSYDHLFTVDGKCAYGQSSEGFEKAVGLQEYRKGLVISEEDKKYCETIFTSPVSADFVSGLDSEIWQWDNDVKLLIPNIYLNGCQTSFSLENDSKLTEKGALVSNLEVKLRYTGTGNNSGIIKFGIVDENLNYKILTTGYDGSEKTLIEWIEAADLPSGVTIDYTKLTCIFITLTLTEGQNK